MFGLCVIALEREGIHVNIVLGFHISLLNHTVPWIYGKKFLNKVQVGRYISNFTLMYPVSQFYVSVLTSKMTNSIKAYRIYIFLVSTHPSVTIFCFPWLNSNKMLRVFFDTCQVWCQTQFVTARSRRVRP